MKKRNLSLSVIIIFSFILCNSTYAENNIENLIEKASESFAKDMNTLFARTGFESLHLRYNEFKIDHVKNNYEHPERYKKNFNSFFQKNFSSRLRDKDLIMNFREWIRYTKTYKIIESYLDNQSEYMAFLDEIKRKDDLFKIMPYEDIIKIQIYSNFVIVSGGPKFFLIAEDETYIWPFCKKKKKKE